MDSTDIELTTRLTGDFIQCSQRTGKDRRRRAEVCKSLAKDSDKQRFLRDMICDIAKQDLLHWILTPHYNKSHHDHFHVEIREGIDYVLFK